MNGEGESRRSSNWHYKRFLRASGSVRSDYHPMPAGLAVCHERWNHSCWGLDLRVWRFIHDWRELAVRVRHQGESRSDGLLVAAAHRVIHLVYSIPDRTLLCLPIGLQIYAGSQ